MTKSSEPMFNFSEPTPVYWAGVMIAIQVLTLVLPSSLGQLIAKIGVLRPLSTGYAGLDWLSLVGHGFLHSGWGHVLMNSLFGIVFGIVTVRGAKMLATSRGTRSSGSGAFLMLFFAGVLLGGILQWVVWSLSGTVNAAMVGASGGVSALFAAAGWAMGGKSKMLQFGIGWIAINVVLVLAAPITGVNISWAGHIGGYLAGMIVAPFLVRANSTGFQVLR